MNERDKKLLALLKEKGRIVFSKLGAGVIDGIWNMNRDSIDIPSRIVSDHCGLLKFCLECGAPCGDLHKLNCSFIRGLYADPIYPIDKAMTIYVDKSLPENVVQVGNTREVTND